MKTNVLIVGAGPAGIFTAYEAIKLPVKTLSLSVNRSGTKFAEKTSAH